MSKLTYPQKEELKRLVIDGIVSRLTTFETQKYVKDKLGVEISTDYLNHIKSDLKKDSRKELERLQKDRFAYINTLFFDRIEEVKSYQRKLWEIVNNPSNKPEVKIKAIDSLLGTSQCLSNFYPDLPMVCRNSMAVHERQLLAVEEDNNKKEEEKVSITNTSFVDEQSKIY